MIKQAFNPFLPSWEYIPDGEPRVFDNRVYLYGSHDRFNGKDFCLNDYVCWSAPVDDLSDWRYEGVIYKKEQDPRNKDGKMHMCAPDCVRGADGRYYLYYQLHALQCTCVAVSNSPVGPFEYHGCVCHKDKTPWGEKKGDSFIFDPGVLVDDDKRVYLYAGNSPKPGLFKSILKLRGNRVEESVCLELEDDMCTVKGGEFSIVPGPKLAKGTKYEGHGFYEASSIRKVKEKYYYVYSSEKSHELCYAVSDKPTEGFQFGGTIISIADLGYKGNTLPKNYTGNTHGGMTQIGDDWFIFYHRQTNQIKCSRQACAEKIRITEQGEIPQVEVTSCGLNKKPLRAKGRYEARIACGLSGKNGILNSDTARKKDKKKEYPYFTQSGEDREKDGDQYIANMKDGSYCTFKYFEFEGDESKIAIRIYGNAKGICRVFSDEDNEVACIPVEAKEEVLEGKSDLRIPKGTHSLRFCYEGEGYIDFYEFEVV
ncbi:MAG: family 43 glycosylhydrolase [Lachnospiraceae bacterium]|nr:family 43 glycosylhydrolase [Lachnospiraceae bacterium]